MKKLLLLSGLCTLMSFGMCAQAVYRADTAFTTDVGYGGAPASCISTAAYGFDMNRHFGIWLADTFSVPADSTWVIDTVIIYGIQKGVGTTSAFISCNLQIYDSTPGLGGTVIWGDTVTNVLESSGFTGIYIVDTLPYDGGLTDTLKPIMYLKLHFAVPPHLTGGTYWLSWSARTISYLTEAACSQKVLPGRINPPGQAGRIFITGIWQNALNNGENVGFNKIIKSGGMTESAGETSPNHDIALSHTCPEPFRITTNIYFYTAQPGYAKLSVYNSVGQFVITLLDGETNAGEHKVIFNCPNLPAGVYYYVLTTGAGIESKQMLMVK